MIAERTSRRIELIASLVVIAGGTAGFFAVPYMVATWAFVIPGLTDASLSPTFFPQAAMLALAAAGLGMALSVRQRNDVIPVVAMSGEEWRRALVACANVAAYAILIPIIGFVASSAVFIAGMAASAGYRRMTVIIPTAILFPIVTSYIFRWGLKVLLPSGTIM